MAKKLVPARSLPASPKKKKSVQESSYWSGLNETLATDDGESMPPVEVHGIRRASIRKRIL